MKAKLLNKVSWDLKIVERTEGTFTLMIFDQCYWRPLSEDNKDFKEILKIKHSKMRDRLFSRGYHTLARVPERLKNS